MFEHPVIEDLARHVLDLLDDLPADAAPERPGPPPAPPAGRTA
ncbi:hypothetical protein [Streptomyces sp. Y1]|uniref:Uncharacterized protein n=1 Tax=Streptomyces sp. Y1 TaxID=3238634 RepID=A0AB39TYC7_9ACTN